MKKQFKNDAITSRNEDFAQWYTDVCRKAELMDYGSVKGSIIYMPYGYAIWENIQAYFDKKIKDTNHKNVYFPLLIPESLLEKEADHVEGFAPECAIVTHGGQEQLAERLFIRPTSEVLFCEHYAKAVNSYRDLPKLYNQWCSVLRWEKTTRPFLRGSEFLWQEGHTIHASEQEAVDETLMILDFYRQVAEDLLAIPVITGQKSEREKFAGAHSTYTMEAMMYDLKALQSGTSHYFGSGFAKAFDIKFLNKNNQLEHVYQTSWGISTRLIGGLIMVHGDDNGLIMPPKVAPTQVIIVPIMQHKEGVLEKVKEIALNLKQLGYRVEIDDSDKTPGFKFAQAEMRGIPVRLELGPKDLDNGTCFIQLRHNHEKTEISISDIANQVDLALDRIHNEMFEKALSHRHNNTHTALNYNQLTSIIEEKGGFIKAMWCDGLDCELKIKEETGATIRCIPFEQDQISEVCVCCNKPAKHMVYLAKAY